MNSKILAAIVFTSILLSGCSAKTMMISYPGQEKPRGESAILLIGPGILPLNINGGRPWPRNRKKVEESWFGPYYQAHKRSRYKIYSVRPGKIRVRFRAYWKRYPYAYSTRPMVRETVVKPGHIVALRINLASLQLRRARIDAAFYEMTKVFEKKLKRAR